MLRRLEYLLFVICIILAALFTPKFLFAIQDRTDNQTVYAEYQEINISSVLVSNYIEDDAERYTAYLYRKSQGTRYEAMELESSLSTGEILSLLLKALYREDSGDYFYDFSDFFDGNVMSLSSTQYAVYNAEDHSDIMFLTTLITIVLDNGNPLISDDGNITTYDTIRILVDSQTGALYFIGFYYVHNFYEAYGGLFTDNDANAAAEVYSDLFYDLVFDMQSLTYADLWAMAVYPYIYDEENWLVASSRYAEPSMADYDYTEIGWAYELTQDNGFLTGVKFPVYGECVDFYISFAVKSPEEVPSTLESSYVTVTAVTQINTYESEEYSKYGSNVCISLWDFASLFPEFNYMWSFG